MPAIPLKHDPILIVGAGVFGLTTALELSDRGYKNITVLDRFLAPVPDGSSNDISRIIRADYADPHYAKMALEAQVLWGTKFREFYSTCGFVMLSETQNHTYIEKSKATLTMMKLPLLVLETESAVTEAYPAFASAGSGFKGLYGYGNNSGGWANAHNVIRALVSQCSLAGISFVTGQRGTVLSLRKSGKRITGVNVALGAPLLAPTVIVAAGAWSCRLVDMTLNSLSTCQPLGFIQLTSEEAADLRKLPVLINMTTGFFSFPPDPATNLLKVARHGFGYTTQITGEGGATVSAPLRDSNGASRPFIPADADKVLRDGLRQFFPKLADRPWQNARLCWYTDTPKGDFIVDYHPEIEGLFVATGGSGHAFKFLPVLGRYIVDCLENIADEELRKKWKFTSSPIETVTNLVGDGSRGGPPRKTLTHQQLASL